MSLTSTAPLPDYEKGLLGGAATIRGYDAGYRAGDNIAAASAELRIPLTTPLSVGRFGIKAFVDAGSTSPAPTRPATFAGTSAWASPSSRVDCAGVDPQMSRLNTLRLAVAAVLVSTMMGGAMFASQRSAAAMAKAAGQFLDGLTAEQRATAAFPFASDERLRWHFIPNEMFPRKGLMLKEMNEGQRRLAHDLLRTGLSARGYHKVTSIIQLEDVLKVMEAGGKFARNKEEYLFSVFGTPGPKGAWGWRLEGHHISVRFTIDDGSVTNHVASSPMFLGSNPAEVREGDRKGARVLGEEEDTARALVLALSPDQLRTALVNAVAPTDILTINKNDITPLPDEGVLYSALQPKQQEMLVRIIEVYTSTMEADVATERLAVARRAGLDQVRFAWAGETEKGKKHYYRIQGPTFLIEFDNTQNDGNHVHSVWRDFTGDFGRDLLREHLVAIAH